MCMRLNVKCNIGFAFEIMFIRDLMANLHWLCGKLNAGYRIPHLFCKTQMIELNCWIKNKCRSGQRPGNKSLGSKRHIIMLHLAEFSEQNGHFFTKKAP